MAPITKNLISGSVLNSLSRILGFARLILIGCFIGLTSQLDSRFVAVAVYTILVMTFQDVFEVLGVPYMVRQIESGNYERFKAFSGKLFSLSLLITFVAVGLIVSADDILIKLIVPGYSKQQIREVVKLLYYLMPMAVFFLPFHAIGSALRARKEFAKYFFANLVNSLCTLILVVFLHKDVFDIAIGASISQFIAFVVIFLMSFTKMGYISNPFSRDTFGILILAIGPLLGLHFLGHLNVYFEKLFSSYLSAGALSTYQYGIRIAGLPVVMIPIATIYMSFMSSHLKPARKFDEGVSLILFVSLPLTLFVFFFSERIISVMFGHGNFSPQGVQNTAKVLRILVMYLPVFFFHALVYRLYNVLNIVSRFGIAMFVGTIIQVLITFICVRFIHLGAAALAFGHGFNQLSVLIMSLCLLPREAVTEINFKQHFQELLTFLLIPSGIILLLLYFFSSVDIAHFWALVIIAFSGMSSYLLLVLMPCDICIKIREEILRLFGRALNLCVAK